MKLPPNEIANHFFRSLMHNQCHLCWGLFSKKSQAVFLKWTIDDIYSRHRDAAEFAKLGPSEVKLLFENNDASLMKTFWKRFFFNSNANEFFRYGYYNLQEEKSNAKRAVIEILCQYADGQTSTTEMLLFFERGGWKLGYVESKLPF